MLKTYKYLISLGLFALSNQAFASDSWQYEDVDPKKCNISHAKLENGIIAKRTAIGIEWIGASSIPGNFKDGLPQTNEEFVQNLGSIALIKSISFGPEITAAMSQQEKEKWEQRKLKALEKQEQAMKSHNPDVMGLFAAFQK